MIYQLPASASKELHDLVRQMNEQQNRPLNGPTPLAAYPTADDLPLTLSDRIRATAYCDDVDGAGTPARVEWDGSNWRRGDTNAVL